MANLDDPARLSRFQGQVVDSSPDDVLDECVREAARRAEAPIALVSFVMGQVQYFRAGCGLPPELDLSRATSRCHSYCQFVVRSEKPVIIRDILAAPDMPQALAQTYGIRAYLGVPVSCEGQILGSLCVADVKTRDWGDAIVDALLPLSQRVTARLDELAAASRLARDAVAGTPAEAVLLAQSVSTVAQVIERALAEVGPMVRLAGGLGTGTLDAAAFTRGTTALKEAVQLYYDLIGAAREVSDTSERLTMSLGAQSAASPVAR
jgi:GAF domain-containing protein